MKVSENPKLNDIVATAQRLFYRHGIRRVSIEEICQTARVSKMTFYKFFKNKADLLRFLMDQIYDVAVKEYREIINQKISYDEIVKQMIDWKLKQQEQMSQEFIQEYMQSDDPAIHKYFREKQEEILKIVLDDIVRAQKNKEIRQDIKPEFIYFILNKIIEFYQEDVLRKLYETPIALTEEIVKFFFYGIMIKK